MTSATHNQEMAKHLSLLSSTSLSLSSSSSSSTSNRKVVKAVVVTAVVTLIIAGFFFFFFYRRCIKRQQQKDEIDKSSKGKASVKNAIRKFNRVKEVIVDENERDFTDVKSAETKKVKTTFPKIILNHCFKEAEEEKMEDVAVEKPRKIKPQDYLHHELSYPISPEKQKVKEQLIPEELPAAILLSIPSPPLSPISSPLRKEIPSLERPTSHLTKDIQVVAPPSPRPPPGPAPPLLPPLPPFVVKRSSTPPPPPPRGSGLLPPKRPPPAPGMKTNKSRKPVPAEEIAEGTTVGNTKLKPLHWDKILANADHSMVWDHIKDGSLRFDDELEMLFGYTATSRGSSPRSGVSSSPSISNSTPAHQIFLLEPRKSQNRAIVLKSLAASRKEILDAILEGHGLTADVLEKLTRISPTQEEAAKILQFNGNPTKLADAETFLYHILKAVPSAFTRINAMLFRSNCDAEILHLKESLQTLELACKELRMHGLFFKLLEAILKAGNRMNAGTSRGNAQGFNLTALRKLSDVKSTDRKTSLLHFVVEQVARSEGRRCTLNRDQVTKRPSSQNQPSNDMNSDATAVEERNKEYLLFGLPVLRRLSTEFSNVKKAATMEYDSFINTCSSLTIRGAEILLLLTQCTDGEGGTFVREMKGFLEECHAELKAIEEEQIRVINLVKKTTEYYQAGADKRKEGQPLQLFVIVKEFLDSVDQVCIEISRKLKPKITTDRTASSSPAPPTKNQVRFP